MSINGSESSPNGVDSRLLFSEPQGKKEGTHHWLSSVAAIAEITGDKTPVAALEKEFFKDFAFSSHIPPHTLKYLGLDNPNSPQSSYEAVAGACRDPNVLKVIDVHGWTATHEIFELDVEGVNWTTNVIDRAKELDIPVLVINVDSAGWGGSTLTDDGIKRLEMGPGYHYIAQHFGDEPELQAERLAQEEKTFFATIRKSLGDQHLKSTMPGSIEHSTQALRVCLDDVFGIKGNTVMVGHSQGEKVIKQYLHAEDKTYGKP